MFEVQHLILPTAIKTGSFMVQTKTRTPGELLSSEMRLSVQVSTALSVMTTVNLPYRGTNNSVMSNSVSVLRSHVQCC